MEKSLAPLVSLFFSSKLISKTWGSFFCLSFFLPQPSLCWGMAEMNPNGDDLWPFLSYSSTQQTRLPFSCYSSCALFIGISFWLLCFLLGPSLVFHFPLLSYIESGMQSTASVPFLSSYGILLYLSQSSSVAIILSSWFNSSAPFISLIILFYSGNYSIKSLYSSF